MAEENETEETPVQENSLSLLAREHFGSNYVGEVKEAPEEETTEEPAEDTGEEEETPEETEEATEESEEEPPEESEETISSLDELVETQEWDPDWAYNLKVKVKVDGEEQQVPLQEALKSYQMSEAAERRLNEAKEKSQQQQETIEQERQQAQEQLATAAKMIERVEQTLDRDTKNIDWQKLREEDPAEYSAKKQEIQERRQQIEQMKEEAKQEWQKNVQSSQQEMEQQRQQVLQQEQQALLEKVPEWKDQEKAKEEKTKIAKYLINQGLTQQEVENAADHRLILLARKAMMFDEGQQRKDTAKQKMKKTPKKSMKPGSPKSQDQRSQEQLNKQRQQLKKSGKIEDALGLLQAERKGR